jgi:hypothetical protein
LKLKLNVGLGVEVGQSFETTQAFRQLAWRGLAVGGSEQKTVFESAQETGLGVEVELLKLTF